MTTLLSTGVLIGPASMGDLSEGIGLNAAFLLPLARALLSLLWFTRRSPGVQETAKSPSPRRILG